MYKPTTPMNQFLHIITAEQMQGMASMQASLNQISYPEWLLTPPDYRLAALVELLGEGIDHTPWKWWKAGELNANRLFLELIDVLHFVLSQQIVDCFSKNGDSEDRHDYAVSMTAKKFTEAAEYSLKTFFKVVSDVGNLITQKGVEKGIKSISLDLLTEEDSDQIVANLFLIMHRLGYTGQDIYVSYLGKNILNRFRQENGYKQGTYKKTWIINPIGDNDLTVLPSAHGVNEDNDYLQNYLRLNVGLPTDELVSGAQNYLATMYVRAL